MCSSAWKLIPCELSFSRLGNTGVGYYRCNLTLWLTNSHTPFKAIIGTSCVADGVSVNTTMTGCIGAWYS